MPADLVNHTLWWEGPSWLSKEPIQTPIQPALSSDSAPELRIAACDALFTVPPELIEGRYSCYHLALKVTTWCLRYVHNLAAVHNHLPKVMPPNLTAHEIRQAEFHLFR